MKMRKSTWLLLVLALAAILLVAGCAPTTPGNGDEEPGNGEPTPDDKACPKVVKTEVSKLYVADPNDLTKPNFQIKITFDENINSSCIENPDFWTITVANPGRAGTPDVSGISVDVSGKVVTVKARVEEDVTYKVKYETETGCCSCFTAKTGCCSCFTAKTEINYTFPGLICNKADAEAYAEGYENSEEWEEGLEVVSSTPAEPTYADKVTWKLEECAVYDDLGNVCCDFEGEACCVEPYCEECPPDWCDFTEPGACK